MVLLMYSKYANLCTYNYASGYNTILVKLNIHGPIMYLCSRCVCCQTMDIVSVCATIYSIDDEHSLVCYILYISLVFNPIGYLAVFYNDTLH